MKYTRTCNFLSAISKAHRAQSTVYLGEGTIKRMITTINNYFIYNIYIIYKVYFWFTFFEVLMRKLCSVLCAHVSIHTYFNNSLTVDIVLYDEIFVPLHCQDEDGDDAPTRGKRFSHVH